MLKQEKMGTDELYAKLRQFSGGDEWTMHKLTRNVLFSEGLKYLAENAGAYWLIDAIAYQLAANPKIKKERQKNKRFARLHFWHLRKTGESSAVLEAIEDKGMKPVISREIKFTDFPFDPSGKDFIIYAADDGPGTPITLFLPSEY